MEKFKEVSNFLIILDCKFMQQKLLHQNEIKKKYSFIQRRLYAVFGLFWFHPILCVKSFKNNPTKKINA